MNYLKYIVTLSLSLFLLQHPFAGNKDRIGQSGAGELLINPWVRSAGFAGANSTTMVGLESMRFNVAGLAFTNKTEIQFSGSNYLSGSESTMGAFGLAQRVGESGVLGLSVMSLSFGDIPITTEALPEGGLGNFSPQLLNLGLAYAREFSNSIYGGIVVRSVNQSIANASASAVCFDAGIRYVTGKRDNLKFGIALRNVGPKMRFQGDGFDQTAFIDDKDLTVTQRIQAFELPSIMNLGVSYDIYLFSSMDSTGESFSSDHRITPAGTFTSNSFGKDQIRFGVEYGFRDLFMIRSGLLYEEGIFGDERTTVYTGLNAGFTVQIPLNDNGSKLGLDYSYRDTNPFNGVHSIGIRLDI